MLKIGIIGLGVMGRIHASNLALEKGAVIHSVFDPKDTDAQLVAQSSGAKLFENPDALIRDPQVDAILIASPAHFHWEQVKLAVAHGKPVFVEKPLITDPSEKHEVEKLLETAAADSVWLGFMRRFDPSFAQLKRALDSNEIGSAIFAEMSHRNPAVPESFDDFSYMLETFVHECDIASWLFGEQIVAAQIDALGALGSGTQRHDPIFATLFLESGLPIRLTGHINNSYAYEIRCEVVGSSGSIKLDDRLWVRDQKTAPDVSRAENWGSRFSVAYSSILSGWLADISGSRHTGTSMADGLRASKAAWALFQGISKPGAKISVE